MDTTNPTGATDRATRRAKVRRLADDSHSNREIARRLDIGKDTVRRDLAAEAPAAPGPCAMVGGRRMHPQRKALRAGELEERRKSLLDTPEAGMVWEPGEEGPEQGTASVPAAYGGPRAAGPAGRR
ncbi:hypothetical protein [Streptomyces sp. NPDC059349]|uniref:hypothetical protein n=1 Tax=Streptomyces sp. NPDC059349 TaxID=3346808 RepID=UPI0036965012